MKNRPRSDRSLIPTLPAHQKASCCCPTAAGRALGATEPARPPQPSQVGTAGTFCREALLKLGEGPHFVLHAVIPLRLGRTGVKCIVHCVSKLYKLGIECQARGCLRVLCDIRAGTDLTNTMPSLLLCPILPKRAQGPM